MQSGCISFSRLFEYIRQHSEIPHKNEVTFAAFKDLYLELTRNVADIPGWYVWAQVSADCAPRAIYIGQSQARKTASLQARLKEEFLDEFVALWCTVHGPGQVDILCRKYGGKYDKDIRRSARKSASTHIVWFGKKGISDQELDVIEHALIARYNPPANKQSRSHPTSFTELMAEADVSLQSELSKLVK